MRLDDYCVPSVIDDELNQTLQTSDEKAVDWKSEKRPPMMSESESADTVVSTVMDSLLGMVVENGRLQGLLDLERNVATSEECSGFVSSNSELNESASPVIDNYNGQSSEENDLMNAKLYASVDIQVAIASTLKDMDSPGLGTLAETKNVNEELLMNA